MLVIFSDNFWDGNADKVESVEETKKNKKKEVNEK
jgi:hypothetical protein